MTSRIAGALLLLALAGCGDGTTAPDAPTDGGGGPGDGRDGAVPAGYGEACGNALDDDGDGLADEDCGPRLFAGVYAPQLTDDPALAAIEGASARPLHVVQTYRSLAALGIQRAGQDLAAIWARGQVPHLNVEPAGYAAGQYAQPEAAPLATDLGAMATTIAQALADAPTGRMLLTFGAEMNGSWTTWGCLPASEFIALYRSFHAAVVAALDARGIDRRRVRWVYGPDARGSGGCASTVGYYPGHAYVDLLGLSAYRPATATVAEAVIAPMTTLLDGVGYPAAWQRDRFVILQTGSRAVTGDDRDAWISDLFATLRDDPRAAGVIYFDAAEWAVPTSGAGWTGLTTALAGGPVTDRGLDATFLPHFWDVAYGDPGFAEIQALRDANVTTGCATGPARFCPDDELTAAAAATLLERAFPGAPVPALTAPITEAALAAAITSLGGAPPPGTTAVATRQRGAVLIARGAGLMPRPL